MYDYALIGLGALAIGLAANTKFGSRSGGETETERYRRMPASQVPEKYRIIHEILRKQQAEEWDEWRHEIRRLEAMSVRQLEAQKKNLRFRPLRDIAYEIGEDWKKPYFGAVPYLAAMKKLRTINDHYGEDRAEEIVARFLSNATTWRGDTARKVKAELKNILALAR